MLLPFTVPLKSNMDQQVAPIVTYLVIILCVLVYWAQSSNESRWIATLDSYCSGDASADFRDHLDSLGLSAETVSGCENILAGVHRYQRRDNAREEILAYLQETAYEESGQAVDLASLSAQVDQAYNRFAVLAAPALTAKLVYDPAHPSLLKMISSALAHIDIFHLGFNLLFFYAFATLFENFCKGQWRFALLMLLTTIAASLAYTIMALPTPYPVPTLGLSGVVSGVIGAAFYLMPRAKISLFVWLVNHYQVWPLPVWLLACWYIGWDLYAFQQEGMNSGVNLVAHLSGALAGYLFARLLYSREKPVITREIEKLMMERRLNGGR